METDCSLTEELLGKGEEEEEDRWELTPVIQLWYVTLWFADKGYVHLNQSLTSVYIPLNQRCVTREEQVEIDLRLNLVRLSGKSKFWCIQRWPVK